ncbi:hypothetical protein Hypma_008298 [Hypsizygus marmoreus]|uniref:Uncharacterized protein n=1 Tax=Hypsizygus marmoreus TaxID=39966 RepID=A0A369JVE4_HYPMA|nr:hypothetical protein Hypma_008298 [Hypsizygus marmoreus]
MVHKMEEVPAFVPVSSINVVTGKREEKTGIAYFGGSPFKVLNAEPLFTDDHCLTEFTRHLSLLETNRNWDPRKIMNGSILPLPPKEGIRKFQKCPFIAIITSSVRVPRSPPPLPSGATLLNPILGA